MNGIGKAARDAIGGSFPGYFAMVMATGIIAIQVNKLGFPVAARALLALAVAVYVLTWVMTLVRAGQLRTTFVAEFRSMSTGPAFFTMSVGTTVLGKSLLLVLGLTGAAEVLWASAWYIWTFLMGAFALNLLTARPKPPIERTINGFWLVIPVATQSLSILTSLLASSLPDHGLMMLVSLIMFTLGGALYGVVIVAVVYRLAFFKIEADNLKPPYWLCMGGAAISTLAGVELCRRVGFWTPQFQPLASLKVSTELFWVLATVWIPVLVLLGIWRHGVHRVPLGYDPQNWTIVFPLAMYAVCTGGVADVLDLGPLRLVSKGFLVLAMLAWSVVFVGLVRSLLAMVAVSHGAAAGEFAVPGSAEGGG